MSSSPNERQDFREYPETGQVVDYGSDTSVPGDAKTTSDTYMPEVQPSTTLSPFDERDDTNAPLAPYSTPDSDDAIITSPIDEHQEFDVQREESVRCNAQMFTTIASQRDYVITPHSVDEHLSQTTGQILAAWGIGPEATSPEEETSGQALRERYMDPYVTKKGPYKARLEMQAHGAPVPPIKVYPFSCLQAKQRTKKTKTSFDRCTALVTLAVCAL
uniref:Uncharacterized protein n=1 Tax=Peronospora matthiolae TaxID=2874970 RepID=A0AAV1TKI2_9STRA